MTSKDFKDVYARNFRDLPVGAVLITNGRRYRIVEQDRDASHLCLGCAAPARGERERDRICQLIVCDCVRRRDGLDVILKDETEPLSRKKRG